jgi:hypothetical protein
MATKMKATKKNSSPMVTGHAKPKAAKSTDKQGTGVAMEKSSTGYGMKDPNTLSSSEVDPTTLAMTVSIGNKNTSTETKGIETRGNGAATKGRTARGPMA